MRRFTLLLMILCLIPLSLTAGGRGENRNLVKDVEMVLEKPLNDDQTQLIGILTPVYLNNWQKESLEDLTDDEYAELVRSMSEKVNNRILVGAVKTGKFGEKLLKAIAVDAKKIWGGMVDHVEEKSQEYDNSLSSGD